MAMAREDPQVRAVETSVRYVEWTPVIAGAIAASALSFVLFTFGASLGLALASSSPTWRDASVALALLSGLYIILVTIASFGLGGYVAGRLRSRWTASAETEEVEFRDGVHGLLVWGLAVALGGLLAAAAATTVRPRRLRLRAFRAPQRVSRSLPTSSTGCFARSRPHPQPPT
jgi:hypothetical protein